MQEFSNLLAPHQKATTADGKEIETDIKIVNTTCVDSFGKLCLPLTLSFSKDVNFVLKNIACMTLPSFIDANLVAVLRVSKFFVLP